MKHWENISNVFENKVGGKAKYIIIANGVVFSFLVAEVELGVMLGGRMVDNSAVIWEANQCSGGYRVL